MKRPVILLLEKKGRFAQELQRTLGQQGYEVTIPSRAIDPLQLFHETKPDLIISGSYLDGPDGSLEVAGRLRQWSPQTPVILIVEESSEAKAIAALRFGVNDYFRQPVSYRELLDSIGRYLPASMEGKPAPKEANTGIGFIGETSSIRKIKEYLVKVAATNCNVLITGETGTGKERVAELIHWLSSRRENPLICINCAAVPESLMESELFGYERGAFTGASSSYQGKLRLAEGGTVFLDEVFEMGSYMQAKILRAIDRLEIFSLGAKKPIPLNIRIMAATNMDPERSLEEGTLRRDLYYRLNVARVHLPPLRERKADIPLLLNHYIQEMNRRYNRQVEGFTDEAMELLLGYSWPGNIRELKNLVEAMFINLPSSRVSLLSPPESFQRLKENVALPQEEREKVLMALLTTKWNKSKAAQKLNWSRKTLYRKLEQYEIQSSEEENQPRPCAT